MPEAPLRIGVWSAVSSLAQATDDKASLNDQEARGRQWAESHGWRVVSVYTVPGHSRDIWRWDEAEEAMPAYAELRADVEHERIDVLHCVDVDRLGRDPALSQAVISLCERHGVEVYSAANPHEVGQRGTGQRYVEAIQMVRAGEENAIRKRRHRMGMRARTRRGLFPAIVPAGYQPVQNARGDTVGAEFTDDAATIREATKLFLQGLPYSEIARRMDAAGYATPTGAAWYPQLVNRWMHNDAYAGIVVWGDVRATEPSEHYPALWDRDTYEAVLRERADRQTTHRRHTSTPLLGIALCKRCGAHMVRVVSGIKQEDGTYPHRYLRCSTYHYARSLRILDGDDDCHANGIQEEIVRDAVIAVLFEIADLDDLRARILMPERSEQQEKIERVELRLRAVTLERERLAEALASGAMDLDVYQAVDAPKRETMLALRARLVELHQERQRTVAPIVRWESVEQLRALIADGWGGVEPSRLNALLRRLGLRVWVEDGRIVEAELV